MKSATLIDDARTAPQRERKKTSKEKEKKKERKVGERRWRRRQPPPVAPLPPPPPPSPPRCPIGRFSTSSLVFVPFPTASVAIDSAARRAFYRVFLTGFLLLVLWFLLLFGLQTGFQLALPGFQEILSVFRPSLPSFTGFYRIFVLLGFSYRVSFTGSLVPIVFFKLQTGF